MRDEFGDEFNERRFWPCVSLAPEQDRETRDAHELMNLMRDDAHVINLSLELSQATVSSWTNWSSGRRTGPCVSLAMRVMNLMRDEFGHACHCPRTGPRDEGCSWINYFTTRPCLSVLLYVGRCPGCLFRGHSSSLLLTFTRHIYNLCGWVPHSRHGWKDIAIPGNIWILIRTEKNTFKGQIKVMFFSVCPLGNASFLQAKCVLFPLELASFRNPDIR